MKRTVLLATFVALLAGCTAGGTPTIRPIDSPLCGSVEGFTISYFAYGEGKMVVVPLSKVRPNTVFVIGLKPLDGFGDADVTVTGTSGNGSWINATGKHDDLPKGIYPRGALEVGCVPSDPEGTEYKYKIDVAKGDVMNSLDPRARVN